VFAIAALTTALPENALALHRQTPFLLDMTPVDGATSSLPMAQGEVARWIVFESASDLLGTGSSGSEIFIFDNEPPRSLGQITNCPAGDSHNPSTGGSGSFVAFDSSCDLLGRGISARQIFIWNRKFGQFQQLTNGPKDSVRPRVDQEGNMVVFQTDSDLNKAGVTGTNLYLWRPQLRPDGLNGDSYFTTITKLQAPYKARNASYGANETVVLFESNGPVLGSTNGFYQLFVWEKNTRRITQLTAGNGDSTNATMDDSGRLVVFQSTADLLNNGSSGTELFLLDRQTGKFTQLTNTATGDSFNASLGGGARFISFVSTGDPLGTGPAGQHLYLYDLLETQIYQITRGASGVSDHPVSTKNTIFFFESSEDPMQKGATGQRIYALNVFEALPGRPLGAQNFELQPGDGPRGSSVRLVTRDFTYSAPIGEGKFTFNVTGRNYDGESGVVVPGNAVDLPPVIVPSFGAVCFEATGNGSGAIDCNGGRTGLNVTTIQDHNLDISQDPFCQTGCREDDPSCQGPLPAPHTELCPTCKLGTCNGGSNAGLQCATDNGCPGGECLGRTCSGSYTVGQTCDSAEDCDPLGLCENGVIAVCNGPVATQFDGPFAAGHMNVSMPLKAKLSTNPGIDQTFCTGDDQYSISDIKTTLRLTTGVTTAGIIDADNSIGGAFLGASEQGAPFDCDKLAVRDTSGGRLVGALTFLDVPTVPKLHDVILTWRFQADPGPPCTVNCPAPCEVDAQCNDFNACNGVETCYNGNCAPGTPVVCSDGNACNGLETCDPSTGACHDSAPPVCNDNNACTTDSCNPIFGCVYQFDNTATCTDGSGCTLNDKCSEGSCVGQPAPCVDGNLCNGTETCTSTGDSSYTCNAGTPLVCDDGDACTDDSCDNAFGCRNELTPAAVACNAGDGDVCNGQEACDPATGTCLAGTPLTCDDSNICTDDSCDPLVGCRNVDNALLCDDADNCTTGDTCANGSCTGTPVSCSNGNFCDGIESCDSGTGACVPGTPPTCDDGTNCTIDSCDPGTGCVFTPDPSATTCDDSNACTSADTCSAGVCSGTPMVVDDGQACNGVETCDPLTGITIVGTPLACDDGVACTVDTCDDSTGCINQGPEGLEGVICQLSALRGAVTKARFGQIKGRKLPRRLVRMIDKTDSKLQEASRSSQPKLTHLLGGSSRRITKLIKIVENSTGKDRIEPSVSGALLGIARGARNALDGVMANQVH
jgi:Tol biopolymer transport system component